MTHDTFSHAPQEKTLQSGAPMRSHDDEVGAIFDRCVHDGSVQRLAHLMDDLAFGRYRQLATASDELIHPRFDGFQELFRRYQRAWDGARRDDWISRRRYDRLRKHVEEMQTRTELARHHDRPL